MRNKLWALEIPSGNLRAFQKMGRMMDLYDNWGSTDNSPTTVSTTQSLSTAGLSNYGGYTTGSSTNATDSSSAAAAQVAYSSGTPSSGWGSSEADRAQTGMYGPGYQFPSASVPNGEYVQRMSDGTIAAVSMIPYIGGLLAAWGRGKDYKTGSEGWDLSDAEMAAKYGSGSGLTSSGSGSGGTGAAGAVGGTGGAGAAGGIPGLGGLQGGSSDYWNSILAQYQAPTWQSDPSGMLGVSKDMATFHQNNVQPAFTNFQNAVNQFGDSGYRGLQRSQAMAGAQQAGDAALRNNFQGLARRGMGMSAGAQAEMALRNANSTALSKVMAATQSDAALRDAYIKGNKELLSAGNEMGGIAAKLGAVGVDAEKARNAFALDSTSLGLKNRLGVAELDLRERLGIMDAAMQQYAIDNKVAMQDSDNWWEFFGTGMASVVGNDDLKKWLES